MTKAITIKDFFHQYEQKGHMFSTPLPVILRDGTHSHVSHIFPDGSIFPVKGLDVNMQWDLEGRTSSNSTPHALDIVSIPSVNIMKNNLEEVLYYALHSLMTDMSDAEDDKFDLKYCDGGIDYVSHNIWSHCIEVVKSYKKWGVI